MSDKGQQEPSMEEILASIRRIISEDGDAGGKSEAAPSPSPSPMAPPPPPPPPPMMMMPEDEEEEEDVLELTQMVQDDGSVVDVDEGGADDFDPWRNTEEPAFPEPLAEPEPEPFRPPPPPPPPPPRRSMPAFDDLEDDEPPPRPRPRARDFDDGLISRHTADVASQHFTHLARQLGDDLSIGPMPVGIRTVEDVVRELLRPLLKEWLDENLPTVVERLVQQEIDRMMRRTQKF